MVRLFVRTTSVLIAISVLTLATTAHAECAWVLWAVGGERSILKTLRDWSPLKTFETHKECEDSAQGFVGNYETRCLPDTVDPRGPKGR